MTIFSDEVLMLSAAEMEEWYERELIQRAEIELRHRHGGGSPGPGQQLTFLEQTVGQVPANFNMIVGQGFPGFNPFSGLNDGWNFLASSNKTGVVAPDGTLTAQQLTEDNTGGAADPLNASRPNTHFMQAALGARSGIQTQAWPFGQFRAAAILQAVGRTRCILDFYCPFGDGAPLPEVSVGFDLAGGHVGYDNQIVNGSKVNSVILATSITPVPNAPIGWYLCTFDFSFPLSAASSAINFGILTVVLDNGSGVAPRSVTYTGNGVSGLNIWWANVLPVGAWSLTNRTFFVPPAGWNLNQIDLLNTGSSQFTWYLKHNWPDNSTLLHGANFFNSQPPGFTDSIAADFSVTNGILTIARDRGGFANDISTAAPVHPNNFTGRVFGFPAVFEANLKWNESIFSTPGLSLVTNTAFWGTSIECLIGSRPGVGSVSFREVDIVEGTIGVGGRSAETCHDWTTADGGIITDVSVSGVYDANGTPINLDYTQFNRYADMYITPAFNGGSFSLKPSFINGIMVVCNFYGATIHPDGIVGNPIGAIAPRDTDHIPLFLGAGGLSPSGDYTTPLTPVPLQVDFVRVFQTVNPT